MRSRSARALLALLLWLCWSMVATANESTASEGARSVHGESSREPDDSPGTQPELPAVLPRGMSIDDVLERAAQPPPPGFPDPVPDDEVRAFLFLEQLEYRLRGGGKDELGWQGQGWIGFDYHRLWVKLEGESVFDGPDEGESETDLLYSRLVTPFWNAQIGLQYASAWEAGDYADRWSGVLALQGLAPGMFEVDASIYLSEHGDLTAALEGEYDLRLTQRLVLQPRVEIGLSAQDVPERRLGAGVTSADIDLRLRYELQRELAPYVGLRYRVLLGETGDRTESAGGDDDHFLVFGGVRVAF